MARDEYEFLDGRGRLQDRYGREQLVLVEKHQAPLSTDVQRGYEWSDEDGRTQVVLVSGTTGANLLTLESVPATVYTASHTITTDDQGRCLEMSHATDTLTVTIPADDDLPDGAYIEIFQLSNGSVTVDADPEVTLRSPDGLVTLAGLYATASLRKRDANDWVLAGDLT